MDRTPTASSTHEKDRAADEVGSRDGPVSSTASLFPACLAIAAGALVLSGWALDIGVLKSVVPGWVAIKANTAVCFVLAGAALLGLSWRRPTEEVGPCRAALPCAANLCAAMAALVGLLTVCEYAFGVDLGIDNLLFTEAAGAAGTVHPGRMALPTAVSFLLAGVALLLLDLRRARWVAFGLACGVVLIALLALLGYIYDWQKLYAFGPFTVIAIPTALVLLVLGTGIVAARPEWTASRFVSQRGATLGLVGGVLLLLIVAGGMYRTVRMAAETRTAAAHAQTVIDEAERLLAATQDMVTGERGFVITGDERFLAPSAPAAARMDMALISMRRLTSGDAEQQRRVTELTPLIERRMTVARENIALRRTEGEEAAARRIAQGEGLRLMDAIRGKAGELIARERSLVTLRNLHSDAAATRAVLAMSLAIFLAMVIVSVAFILLRHQIRQRALAQEELLRSHTELDRRVADRTAELAFKNVLLTTQQNVALDGILVVDEQGQIISFNHRFAAMWGLPDDTLASRSDARALQCVLDKLADPEAFLARVRELYARPDETSREEIALKDGRTFDRYSAGMRGADGRLYGRVWFFRDVTAQRQADAALRERDENLRVLGSVIPGVLWLSTPNLDRMLYVSPSYERMWGRTAASLIENPLSYLDSIHPEDRERVASALAGHADGHYDTEYRLVLPDGNVRWIHDQGAPVHDGQGRLVRMGGVAIDITERKRAELEMQKLSSVVRHSREFINLATLDGRMIFLNEWGRQMVGVDSQALERTHVMDVIADACQERVRSEVLPALLAGGAWRGELQYRNVKTGQVTDVYAITFTVPDPVTGRPLFLANTSIDMTERKRLEADLRQLNADLERRVAERTAELAEANRDLQEQIAARERMQGDLERYYRLTPALVCVAGLDGRFLQLNPAWEKTLGWTVDDLTARPFLEFVHPDDEAATTRATATLAQGDALVSFENRYRCRDGAYRWLVWNAVAEPERRVIYAKRPRRHRPQGGRTARHGTERGSATAGASTGGGAEGTRVLQLLRQPRPARAVATHQRLRRSRPGAERWSTG
jgi:PAS domain S-box-containing protein